MLCRKSWAIALAIGAWLNVLAVSLGFSSQRVRIEVQEGLSLKLDTPLLGASEKKTGQRITQLEGAILRGLKAVSDRVAAALLEKADAEDLNDFRMQVRVLVVHPPFPFPATRSRCFLSRVSVADLLYMP